MTGFTIEVDDDESHVAEVVVEVNRKCRVIKSGIGDTMLLSRRLGLPIRVSAALVPTTDVAGCNRAVVEDFRRFLDQVSPDEFRP